MFHKCNWKEIARTYAPSILDKLESADTINNYAIHGVTTILWECTICHKLRKEELLGKIVEGQT